MLKVILIVYFSGVLIFGVHLLRLAILDKIERQKDTENSQKNP